LIEIRGHTPGAKPFLVGLERPKAEALGYREAKARTKATAIDDQVERVRGGSGAETLGILRCAQDDSKHRQPQKQKLEDTFWDDNQNGDCKGDGVERCAVEVVRWRWRSGFLHFAALRSK
jgi:hypothetical protein